VEQLLDVLEAAHDQNVVHRDIKPDNLFLTDDGKLKVLDFGIARLHQGNHRATKVGSFMGTPAFCAQEQARGRWDEVDHRTDLYSVGATLFTCLTGTHVHEAETSSEQLALAIGATARSLADVMPHAPRELVELVDTALSYDKEDRFQSARAMRAAVQRVKAGLPVTKKISTPAPPASGARTFGPVDPDPDSIRPIPPLREIASRRVLLGALVTLVLGVAIFIASRPGARAEAPESPSAAALGEREKEKLTGIAAPSADESEEAAQDGDEEALDEGPAETDAQTSPGEPVASEKTSSTKAPPGPGGIRNTGQSTPPVTPTPKAAPSSSSQPSPSPSRQPGPDEDMFDRRF
jgi:serine/threonine-protein kinase